MADNVSINPGTTTPIATDDVSGVQFQKMKINLGADGVDGSLWDGKVAVTAGTTIVTSGSIAVVAGTTVVTNLAAGTVTRLEGGTLGLITRVSTLGTLELGTVTVGAALPAGDNNVGNVDVVTGTITSVTDVANLAKGTITRVEGGTIGLITRVSTIGTVEVGTISSIPNTPGGTLGLITRVSTLGTLELGTVTVGAALPAGGNNIGDVDIATGTVTSVTEVANLAKGTITKVEGGTIGLISAISSLSAGTVTRVEGGTISTNMLSGTLNLGTVVTSSGTITSITNVAGGTLQLNPKPSRSIFTFGTVTNGTIGTLVAAPGSGTSVYIQDVSIQVYNGTAEPIISWGLSTTGGGAAGGGPIIRGNFAAGGGQQKSYPNAVNGGTSNVAVTYNILSGSGTVSYLLTYWVE